DAFPLDPTESEDTDNDGIGNNADPDDDGDGLSDIQEQNSVPVTDSLNPDTDGDGYCDGPITIVNVCVATDAFPLDPTKSKDTVSDEDSSLPGFTGVLAALSLLGAAFIRRNE
ncbi:MAG: hypothetical protein HOI28_02730, partial [Euryarchaeota archaeon]|nr:hypothetical protein [Euryarchaeota archaeon]